MTNSTWVWSANDRSVRNSTRSVGWTALASWGEITSRAELPIVAKHADIWHTFASVPEYRRKNAILKELVADAGRDESLIERAVQWTGRDNAEAFLREGVTLFTAEIHPTEDGYDFTEFKDMLAWRDQNR
jgi:hypothetical protein